MTSSSTHNEERLSFSADMSYSNSEMAEHYTRYATVYTACHDKRVLDFSCGEGYGSHLMKTWGAARVVGVDISQDAIDAANERFSSDSVQFIKSSAEEIKDNLGDAKFDLIVSFETIEHVQDPRSMLEAMKSLLAEGGSIVISCPNDLAFPGIDNPFHLKKYTFEDFKDLCESILGSATSWKFGSPVMGHCVAPLNVNQLGSSRLDLLKTLHEANSEVFFAPGQEYSLSSPEKCSYYIGIWGKNIMINPVTLQAISLWSSIEPWRYIDDLKLKVQRLEDELNRQAKEAASYRTIIEDKLGGRAVIGSSPFSHLVFESKWDRRIKKWKNSVKKRLK